MLTAMAVEPLPVIGQEAEAEVPELVVEVPEVMVEAPEVVVEAPEVVVEVRPIHAQLQRSVRFDEEGMPQQQNASLSMQFLAEVHTELEVLSVAPPEVESVTSSFGVPLTLPEQPQRRQGPQPLQRRNGLNGPGSIAFPFNLADPPVLRGINEARGTITLIVAEGPRRELRFVPIERYLDRTAVVEDLDDAEVAVARETNGHFRFTVPDGLTGRFSGIGYATPGAAAAFEQEVARFNNRNNGRSTLVGGRETGARWRRRGVPGVPVGPRDCAAVAMRPLRPAKGRRRRPG